MSINRRVFLIKIVHSLIWLIMAAAVFYILYCGIVGLFNWLLLAAFALIIIETVVLVFNHWTCPFTDMAKQADANWKDGDDIFLPKWIAVHNKTIFGSLFVVGMTLVLARVFIQIF